MAESIKFWGTYFLIVGAILAIGWHQPLSYRFKNKQEIAALSNTGEPTPAPGSWMWDPSKRASKLEKGAYDKKVDAYSSQYYFRR